MASSEWDRGWKDGYEFAIKYFVKGFYRKEWPPDWGNGHYGSGYAEGQISGRSVSFDRDFPNMISYSNHGTSATITYKNGKKEIVYK